MILYTSIWVALAFLMLTLAAYRKMKARNEDDVLHVSGANCGAADKQATLAHSMAQIDRWGVVLTVVTVVFGLVLLGVYFTGVFEQGQKISNF